MDSDLLHQAIELRKQGKIEESRQFLLSLVDSIGSKGSVYLNIAWSYDNQEMEKEALNYYILSLGEKLSGEDKFEATFGLACTYRCLGELQKAESIFNQLRREYPDASEVIPFYALCLSSLGRKDDAIRLLFDLMLEKPPTEAIRSYKRTLSEYINAECSKPI
ncbi:tetratricopeptide repeat protein [Klebsiella oxytoca]